MMMVMAPRDMIMGITMTVMVKLEEKVEDQPITTSITSMIEHGLTTLALITGMMA